MHHFYGLEVAIDPNDLLVYSTFQSDLVGISIEDYLDQLNDEGHSTYGTLNTIYNGFAGDVTEVEAKEAEITQINADISQINLDLVQSSEDLNVLNQERAQMRQFYTDISELDSFVDLPNYHFNYTIGDGNSAITSPQYLLSTPYGYGFYTSPNIPELKTKKIRNFSRVGVNLEYASLKNADLSNANLSGAKLRYAELNGANLSGADLSYADLTGADLSYADLTGADLTIADLTGVNLNGADLTGADLKQADLSNSYLTGADLTGVNLDGTFFRVVRFVADISQLDYNSIIQFDHAAYEALLAKITAERDARPTQAAYAAVVAERDAKLTLNEVKDLKAGSK
ncbi:MAG: pentapeptide repeat-containing protein [Coraliomargaritaceae bacterium]